MEPVLPLIAKPLWNMTTVLSLSLLAFAATDAKAWFLVGLPFSAVFVYQSLRTRRSLYLIPAGLAWMLAFGGIPTFLWHEGHLPLSVAERHTVFAIGKMFSVHSSRPLARRFDDSRRIGRGVDAACFLITSVLALLVWEFDLRAVSIESLLAGGVVSILLFLHTLYRPSLGLALLTTLWVQAVSLAWMFDIAVTDTARGLDQFLDLTLFATFMGLSHWALSRLPLGSKANPLIRAFHQAFGLVATWELFALLILVQALFMGELFHIQGPMFHGTEILNLEPTRLLWLGLLAVLSLWGLHGPASCVCEP